MARLAAVADHDMPQLFQSADAASVAAQKSYVGRTRWRLLALCAIAVLGVTSWRLGPGEVDALALCAAVLFVFTLLLEASLWRDRPDKGWYDGRAVAESAKTLAWKYAVGGVPFSEKISLGDARRQLVEKFAEIKSKFPDLELAPLNAPAVPAWMDELRSGSLKDRKHSYLAARIGTQKSWYESKSIYNKRRLQQWRAALLILELGGFAASLVEAFISTGLFLGPAIAALAGSAVAWLGTKQHESLARAYSAALSDLSDAESKLLAATDEEGWAVEVDDAEEAISREHTIWLASRSR